MNKFQHHYEESKRISTTPEELFKFVDDHQQFSSHMSQSSWMMGGGKMDVSLDAGQGQKVGSHIRLSGIAFGIKLFLDEVITKYEPPNLKTWETVGIPKLLVIGQYSMSIEIYPTPRTNLLNRNSNSVGSLLRVSIDYNLPITNIWLGWLFGGIYAKWCVRQMLNGAYRHFIKRKG